MHGRLEIRNFSSHVEKYFTRSLRSHVKYFTTLEEKFRISARPCNILYIFIEAYLSPNIIKLLMLECVASLDCDWIMSQNRSQGHLSSSLEKVT